MDVSDIFIFSVQGRGSPEASKEVVGGGSVPIENTGGGDPRTRRGGGERWRGGCL